MGDKKGDILIVDDQENWREVLTDVLTKEGYTVKAVAAFEDAISEISENKFDLLISDVRFEDKFASDIQGIELLNVVKSEKNSLKVMMLTGYPESIPDGVLERYKADALILKAPKGSRFDTKGFKEKVRELLVRNE
ncbi:response regulator [Desulfobacterales bacterium HSG2]|nr:response regulator [Desulfobacterales bacterium HSG2]